MNNVAMQVIQSENQGLQGNSVLRFFIDAQY